MAPDCIFQALGFELPKTGLSVKIKNQVQRQSAFLFHEPIQFQKRHLQTLRERGSQRGLSRPAKSYQRNPSMPRRWIDSAELMEQDLPGELEVIEREASQELHGMCQLHGWLRAIKKQNVNRNIQRLCQLAEHEDGNVSDTAFDLRQVPLRNTGVARELFAGHAPARPRLPHAVSEQL